MADSVKLQAHVIHRPRDESAARKRLKMLKISRACANNSKREVRDATPLHRAHLMRRPSPRMTAIGKTNEMIGAELGYRYVNSPIICDIPGGPEHLFRVYEPTTWPGARPSRSTPCSAGA